MCANQAPSERNRGTEMPNIVIKRADERYLEDICELERLCFTTPWPVEVIYEDICVSKHLYYVICENEKVVGYAGMWLILDEAHINNICVHPDYRCRGYGKKLLKRLIRAAYKYGGDSITLEVRRSNTTAITLYESLGFEVEGVRKGYYQDNREDAIIMWKQGLQLEKVREEEN